MNSKILNDIYHGQLKPWLFNLDERELKQTIREVSKIPLTTLQGIDNRLKKLLQPFPMLLKTIQPLSSNTFQQLSFSCPLQEPTTIQQHFYKAVIDAEVLRYYNTTISNPLIKDEALDVPFQIGDKSLKGIAVLLNSINNELSEKEYQAEDLTCFSLEYLKSNLLILYFSIQENFKPFLPDVYETVEEFYMYRMDNDSEMVEIKQLTFDKYNKPVLSASKATEPPKLTFGWKKGDTSKLQALFDDLCVDYNFLNEEETSVETLVELLTEKEIVPGKFKIYLGCQTTEFVFIMDNLGKAFQRLSPTNIEKSMSFWSKGRANKKPTLINAENYFKTRSKNKIKDETKEEILTLIQKYFP
ncbi:MAG: hypothetical protein JST29_01625 [Bacteroidetes bacterium]|nr:hypothetical protein [Bacteroidota bacterium]